MDVCMKILSYKTDPLYSALLSGTLHIPARGGGIYVFVFVEVPHVPLEIGLNLPSSRFTLLGVDSFFESTFSP